MVSIRAKKQRWPVVRFEVGRGRETEEEETELEIGRQSRELCGGGAVRGRCNTSFKTARFYCESYAPRAAAFKVCGLCKRTRSCGG